MGREDSSKGALSPLELKYRLERSEPGSIILLDIRNPNEFEDWKIDESLNIPMGKLRSAVGSKGLNKHTEIVTICAHGVSSATAAEFLRREGFNARHLFGGLASWSKVYDIASLPLSDDEGVFTVLQMKRLGKGCASYVICYQRECAVIDPTVHVEEFVAVTKKEGLKIRHVMDTHQHADHISGARALAGAVGASLYLNPLDGYKYSDFIPVTHGLTIELGDGKAVIEALHTPGHTKGSTCFLIQGKGIFTGDTLFLEGIARPDLHNKAKEYALDLYNTYTKILLTLPLKTLVFPGHFSGFQRSSFGRPLLSTLGEIRGRTPMIKASETEFTRNILKLIPPTPPNYEAILAINRGDSRYDPEALDELEEGPNRCVLRTDTRREE